MFNSVVYFVIMVFEGGLHVACCVVCGYELLCWLCWLGCWLGCDLIVVYFGDFRLVVCGCYGFGCCVVVSVLVFVGV